MKVINLMIFSLMISIAGFTSTAFAAPIAGIEAKNIAAENCTGNCHTAIDSSMCGEAYDPKTCREIARIKAAAALPDSKANPNTTHDAIKDN